jgi:hypothetical protein
MSHGSLDDFCYFHFLDLFGETSLHPIFGLIVQVVLPSLFGTQGLFQLHLSGPKLL